MKIIALVIGHGPKIDKGAGNKDGTTELAWNTDLALRIGCHLKDKAIVKLVNRVVERLQPVEQTNATGADVAIELHCNSFNGIASGTEMIHHPHSSAGRRLAVLLQEAAVNVLKLPNRGVKPPQGGGRGMRWLAGTIMPAVIVETMFIDNDADLKRANEKKEELAEAYAKALLAF